MIRQSPVMGGRVVYAFNLGQLVEFLEKVGQLPTTRVMPCVLGTSDFLPLRHYQ